MNERIWDKFLTERDKAVLPPAGLVRGPGSGSGRRCS
jgi:hypothetical protein